MSTRETVSSVRMGIRRAIHSKVTGCYIFVGAIDMSGREIVRTIDMGIRRAIHGRVTAVEFCRLVGAVDINARKTVRAVDIDIGRAIHGKVARFCTCVGAIDIGSREAIDGLTNGRRARLVANAWRHRLRVKERTWSSVGVVKNAEVCTERCSSEDVCAAGILSVN